MDLRKKYGKYLGLEQKVQLVGSVKNSMIDTLGLGQKVGCRKKVQQIPESRTKSSTKTSIFSKKYNIHFKVMFQISPPKWTPMSNS